MNIIQTPLRISFLGGGTDVPEYYKEFGGSVIAASFDKYVYHIIRKFPPFFEHKNQFTSSIIERFNSVDQVENPVVREALRYLEAKDVHIVYDSDLPARSGLATSSAFAVGLLNGLHQLRNENLSKKELAEEAILLERTLCNEPGGVQDQYTVALGGFNRIHFSADKTEVIPVEISEERKQELNKSLLLYFTGFSRNSFDIMRVQIQNLKSITSQLREMSTLVDEGENILTQGDLNDFGKLLGESWKLKRSFSPKTTNENLDDLYERAIKSGATGGKVLGAGGGGCILFYVELDKQEYFKSQFDDLLQIDFNFEDKGTNAILNQQFGSRVENLQKTLGL